MRFFRWALQGSSGGPLPGRRGLLQEAQPPKRPASGNGPGAGAYEAARPHEAVEHSQSIYDARAAYSWPEQEYEEPAPWFEGLAEPEPTPQAHGPVSRPVVAPEEERDELADYEAWLAREELLGQVILDNPGTAVPWNTENPEWLTAALERRAALWDVVGRVGTGDTADLAAYEAAYEAQAMAEHWLYGPSGPEEPFGDADLSPMEQGGEGPSPEQIAESAGWEPEPSWGPEPEAEYGDISHLVEDPMDQPPPDSLEAIVQDGMPAPEEMEAPDRNMMEQQTEDDPMQRMMNPFMMPGPFGPGPGP